ncbi:protein FAR1-RELATED SEQUENCE 5-like [Tasmannia lanceolata]|uniref:protein FAR1-RELATED SEQUENCE 5-like n=1 Tax=Tasmannia lanceolata TaxID=3420 RepID=UPI004062D619
MDSNVSQICGHLIDEVDCNGLVVVDDNEVDGNELDVLNEGEIPNEGVFETPKAVCEFYNVYGLAARLGVRKAKTNKSKKILEVITRRFVCEREGFKNTKDKRQIGKEVKLRRFVREDCEAQMEIKKRKEKWVVTSFEPKHCHDLTSPTRRGMHRSHNKFVKNMVCKNLMEKLSDHGVKPCNIARVCTSASGGGSGVTANQVVSHLRVRRRNNMGQEAFLIARQFLEKQAEDPNFYFAMEMDDIGNLRSMFWADSRARNAYLTFADVIVFDVTYKTNRFVMPFAPFTGVNHHRQSTLFGCALLADEKEEPFTWLFQQWLKCMVISKMVEMYVWGSSGLYNYRYGCGDEKCY